MTPPSANELRLLSVLLHYPDDDLLRCLDEIGAAARRLAAGETRTAVEAFLSHLGTHASIRLQENYTAAFDMQSATTLNLTYHAFGDNEKRAQAMARLQRLYDQAGWERISGELPDYLPLLLEFLSIHPRPETAAPVWECMQAVKSLVAGLEKTMPAYAALLRPLARAAAETACKNDGQAPGPA